MRTPTAPCKGTSPLNSAPAPARRARRAAAGAAVFAIGLAGAATAGCPIHPIPTFDAAAAARASIGIGEIQALLRQAQQINQLLDGATTLLGYDSILLLAGLPPTSSQWLESLTNSFANGPLAPGRTSYLAGFLLPDGQTPWLAGGTGALASLAAVPSAHAFWQGIEQHRDTLAAGLRPLLDAALAGRLDAAALGPARAALMGPARAYLGPLAAGLNPAVLDHLVRAHRLSDTLRRPFASLATANLIGQADAALGRLDALPLEAFARNEHANRLAKIRTTVLGAISNGRFDGFFWPDSIGAHHGYAAARDRALATGLASLEDVLPFAAELLRQNALDLAPEHLARLRAFATDALALRAGRAPLLADLIPDSPATVIASARQWRTALDRFHTMLPIGADGRARFFAARAHAAASPVLGLIPGAPGPTALEGERWRAFETAAGARLRTILRAGAAPASLSARYLANAPGAHRAQAGCLGPGAAAAPRPRAGVTPGAPSGKPQPSDSLFLERPGAHPALEVSETRAARARFRLTTAVDSFALATLAVQAYPHFVEELDGLEARARSCTDLLCEARMLTDASRLRAEHAARTARLALAELRAVQSRIITNQPLFRHGEDHTP